MDKIVIPEKFNPESFSSQGFNYTISEESLKQTDGIIGNTFNYSDWNIISEYCTNLNDRLIDVVLIFFVLWIILELNHWLYKKKYKNYYKWFLENYLNAQFFLYFYFVYIYLSRLDVLKYIYNYSKYLWIILIFLYVKLIIVKYLKVNVSLYGTSFLRKLRPHISKLKSWVAKIIQQRGK